MSDKSNASMRTPLGQVRHFGSARSGTKHAWRMRVTSIALLPLTLAFVWFVLTVVGKDYAAVRAAIANPVWSIVLLLFLGAGVYHMMLGMQTIIEDYVHGEISRTWLLMANMFFSAVIGLALVYAVLRIGFA
ncbi:MAG: succinate dehydrogenase, hydrophobic membrane anchor protein [Alphaproteobacteria bacterium]|nr:succinate dehydrogenase, hydrophobic membrane anchor protein [Alphaproteobacteria bacterium]